MLRAQSVSILPARAATSLSRKAELAFVCIFTIGALVRVIGVLRPVTDSGWRESDMASIARNYYREGMNLFYPRVDWRGDGPGYAEMELPILPWLMAVLYKLFGYHVEFGRVLSFGFSLLGLLVFFKLSSRLMPRLGAIAASSFFALSPLAVRMSKSIQPDGLMLLCYVSAVYAFIRWLDDDSWRYYVFALVATALAILAKAPGAHLGPFFAGLVFYSKGLPALRQPRIWLFAVGSLLPAALWYVHARSFWIDYGNSLGLSNEYHWAGWDLFTNSAFISGIAKSELFYVWMPTGLIVAAVAVFFARSGRAVKYAISWLSVIFVYYLVAARTAGDGWAVHYHIVSVPPVALLVGAGVVAIEGLIARSPMLRVFVLSSAIAAATIAVVLGELNLSISGVLGVSSTQIVKLFLVAVIPALIVILLLRVRSAGWVRGIQSLSLGRLVGYLALVSVLLGFLSQARVISDDIRPQGLDENRLCAETFSPFIPGSALILASGGVCRDPTGFPVAFNAPYMFYWLDHKGFNICVEEQSVEAVRSFAERGAKCFVAEKKRFVAVPGFEAELRKTFPVIKECEAAILFDITPSSQTLSANQHLGQPSIEMRQLLSRPPRRERRQESESVD